MSFPTLALNEPIVKTLVSLLEDELPTVVEELNATVTDGYTLSPPAQILDFMPGASLLGGGVPAICTQDMPASFFNDLQFSVDGSHGLGVASVIQNSDQQALAWQLRRYTQAVAQVIQRDRLKGQQASRLILEGKVWVVEFAGTEPGPMLADRDPNSPNEPPSSFLSWTWLMLRFNRTEV